MNQKGSAALIIIGIAIILIIIGGGIFYVKSAPSLTPVATPPPSIQPSPTGEVVHGYINQQDNSVASPSSNLNTQAKTLLVYGSSMDPNYKDHQVWSYATYDTTSPARGEVVIFPNGQNIFDKRVIGLPGETIGVSKGKVLINGQALSEPYLSTDIQTYGGTFLRDDQTLVIPSKHYFVMGDNRPLSSDSRSWGFITGDIIIGKLVSCVQGC